MAKTKKKHKTVGDTDPKGVADSLDRMVANNKKGQRYIA